jgi:sugar phosphate isomerase/epimerase
VTCTRRDFVASTVAAIPVAAGLARAAGANRSVVNGVQLGVQTYSFHEILNDGQNHAGAIIRDMLACGLYSCELFSPQVEPGTFVGKVPLKTACAEPFKGCSEGKGGSGRNPWAWEFQRLTGGDLARAREKQKRWRETISLDYFQAIRKQFNASGIDIFSYNPLIDADASDLELDRICEMAKALGARAINISTTLPMLKRMVPFAEKNQIIVAPHGHSVTWEPEAFSTRETFVKALALSKWVGANLDIGHYTATRADPVAFIDEFHDRITNLHVKDRKKNTPGARLEDGANVAWGQGDTPIQTVLQLLKKRRYAIPAFIEYEHAGSEEPVGEVKKCFKYCKDALA